MRDNGLTTLVTANVRDFQAIASIAGIEVIDLATLTVYTEVKVKSPLANGRAHCGFRFGLSLVPRRVSIHSSDSGRPRVSRPLLERYLGAMPAGIAEGRSQACRPLSIGAPSQ